jgi:hypothetical protein
MSDTVTDSKLDDLERRVQTLESKVASLPPPVDPTQAPSFKDIELPIPNVQTVVGTAKTTWAIIEVLAEIKTMLWMLVDRRYHMGWLARIITIILLVAILTSHWWAPFAVYGNFVSHLWDKLIDLALGLLMFMILIIETRRYKEWRSKR